MLLYQSQLCLWGLDWHLCLSQHMALCMHGRLLQFSWIQAANLHVERLSISRLTELWGHIRGVPQFTAGLYHVYSGSADLNSTCQQAAVLHVKGNCWC